MRRICIFQNRQAIVVEGLTENQTYVPFDAAIEGPSAAAGEDLTSAASSAGYLPMGSPPLTPPSHLAGYIPMRSLGSESPR